MLQWKIAWRGMRTHPGRALLTWLSVVIGVTAVLAVGLSAGSAQRAYQEMFQAITGRAALEITAAGGGPLDASLLDVVRKTPGVQAAVPLIQRNAIMYYHGGRMKLVALGIDPSLDAAVRDYTVVEGQEFSQQGGVWLDAALARSLGVKVSDQIRLLVRRGLAKTTVVGLVQPRSGPAAASGGVLFMPLSTAQRRFAAPRRLDRIQITLTDEAELAAVQSELARSLPSSVQIQPPATRSEMAEETMLALENGLRLATAFSLLAAAFIITNTFLMNVGQRRRQFAVMRGIGATREQIVGLVLREALLLGAVGTVAGVGAGLVGARLLNTAMGIFFQAPLPPIELQPLPLTVAAALGMALPLSGVLFPARKAAGLSPMEGISGIANGDIEGHSSRAAPVGLAVMGVSAGLFSACLAGWLPLEVSVAVTVLATVGLVLLLPLVLRPLTYLAELTLRPLARVESRLARRQLLRHAGRQR